MPFFCSMAVAVATRGRGGAADRASSRFSTPVLLLDDGRLPKAFAPAELGEIVSGSRKPPTKPRIVFKSVGNAAQDIFCVEHVLARAESNDVGRFVDL